MDKFIPYPCQIYIRISAEEFYDLKTYARNLGVSDSEIFRFVLDNLDVFSNFMLHPDLLLSFRKEVILK